MSNTSILPTNGGLRKYVIRPNIFCDDFDAFRDILRFRLSDFLKSVFLSQPGILPLSQVVIGEQFHPRDMRQPRQEFAGLPEVPFIVIDPWDDRDAD